MKGRQQAPGELARLQAKATRRIKAHNISNLRADRNLFLMVPVGTHSRTLHIGFDEHSHVLCPYVSDQVELYHPTLQWITTARTPKHLPKSSRKEAPSAKLRNICFRIWNRFLRPHNRTIARTREIVAKNRTTCCMHPKSGKLNLKKEPFWRY